MPRLTVKMQIILLVLTVLASLFFWQKWQGPEVSAMVIKQQPLVQSVVASGEVRSQSLARIGSEITGIIKARHVREGDKNLSVIIEMLTQLGTQSIMAQRYLPEIVDGDKRILLIAGEVVPFALARIPMIGESRGNMAAGGRPEARPLTTTDRQIAETMAKRLWAEGLFLVGLDVIGSKVTEINVTSPTGFVEIKAQTGFDVAAMFVQKLESVVSA